MYQKTYINTQNVQLFVEDFDVESGLEYSTDKFIECILELSSLKQSRATEEYSCMSSSNSHTSTGSITRDPLTFRTVYTEDLTEGNGGYEFFQQAFINNDEINISILFDNGADPVRVSGTPGNGTKIVSNAVITSFELVFEKDKLIETVFEIAYVGDTQIVKATPPTP